MAERLTELDKLQFDLDRQASVTVPPVDVSNVGSSTVSAQFPIANPAVVSGQSSQDQHLGDYIKVLHKRRGTAFTAFLIVFGSVTIYSFTATPLYTSRVQILIENENPNVVKFEEVYEQNKTTIDYYQTQYRILQSRLLAPRRRTTVDTRGLPAFPWYFAEPLGLVGERVWRE
jgi:hypothetical protein